MERSSRMPTNMLRKDLRIKTMQFSKKNRQMKKLNIITLHKQKCRNRYNKQKQWKIIRNEDLPNDKINVFKFPNYYNLLSSLKDYNINRRFNSYAQID